MEKKPFEMRTRKVDQPYRKFNDETRREYLNQIINRPKDMSLQEACKILGIDDSLYYVWIHRLGMESHLSWRKKRSKKTKSVVNSIEPMVVKITKPMVESSVRKTVCHTITMSVEVGSLMELIGFCNEIGRIPKVKTILSVE